MVPWNVDLEKIIIIIIKILEIKKYVLGNEELKPI
jgi:hypothetical protein